MRSSSLSIVIAAGGSTVERMANWSTSSRELHGVEPVHHHDRCTHDPSEQDLVDARPQGERHGDQVGHRCTDRTVALRLERRRNVLQQREHPAVREEDRLRPSGRPRRELDERDVRIEPAGCRGCPDGATTGRPPGRPPGASPIRSTCSAVVMITLGSTASRTWARSDARQSRVERKVGAAEAPDAEEGGNDLGIGEHHADRHARLGPDIGQRNGHWRRPAAAPRPTSGPDRRCGAAGSCRRRLRRTGGRRESVTPSTPPPASPRRRADPRPGPGGPTSRPARPRRPGTRR